MFWRIVGGNTVTISKIEDLWIDSELRHSEFTEERIFYVNNRKTIIKLKRNTNGCDFDCESVLDFLIA